MNVGLMGMLLPPWLAACASVAVLGLSPSVQAADRSPEQWFDSGRAAVERASGFAADSGRARNVILFVGDGMGIATITAARILAGQRRGESGEENSLSFERLPWLALSKTYSVNQQTSDSAPTMTAMVTGIKTNDGAISVNARAKRGDYRTVAGNAVMTIVEQAEEKGMATGVVTTARLTHATPAACYAHTSDRDWEADADQPAEANAAGFPDIARQLIEFGYGDGLEVALGGGRAKFLPDTVRDPEYPAKKGQRRDGRNLAEEWAARPGAAWVWNKAQFDAIDPGSTRHLLGLFEPSHMQYAHDRDRDSAGEPSLSEMTAKAIDLLSVSGKGFFLMVEAGRIDHAHHAGNAFRALTDTIELSNAVETALARVDLNDTLVIVTADHSHVFTMGGYPKRGNDILGKTRGTDEDGFSRNRNGMPYTTLGYANGPGYRGPGARPDLTAIDTAAPDYQQEATVPLESETHGGEDVAIFAGGPLAHLFRGVLEQHVIYHVMAEALDLERRLRAPRVPR
jgi:alkaline phosphatase